MRIFKKNQMNYQYKKLNRIKQIKINLIEEK